MLYAKTSILQSNVGEFNFVVELDTPFRMKDEKGATSACFELFSDFGEWEKSSSAALIYGISMYVYRVRCLRRLPPKFDKFVSIFSSRFYNCRRGNFVLASLSFIYTNTRAHIKCIQLNTQWSGSANCIKYKNAITRAAVCYLLN